MLGSKMSTWKSLVTWTVEGKSFLSASLVFAQHNPVEDPTVLYKTICLINVLRRKHLQIQDLDEFHHCISNTQYSNIFELFAQDYWEGNTGFVIVLLFCVYSLEQTVKEQGYGKSFLRDPAGATRRVIKIH